MSTRDRRGRPRAFHGEPMCLFTRLAIALRKLGHHQVRVRPTVMLG